MGILTAVLTGVAAQAAGVIDDAIALLPVDTQTADETVSLSGMARKGQILTDETYSVIFANYLAPAEQDVQLLILSEADESSRLEDMHDADATFRQLLENTTY